jgi:release factor glutamine methyltransferase
MKTLLEVVTLASTYLKERGVERSKREAEEVIADCLNLKRIDLYLQFDRPLIEEELTKCREAMVRRGKGEPSQYISGKVFFAGVEIKVNPSVLIPRPETEFLIEKISETLSNSDLSGKTLFDLCTGSGYIAIALKKRFPTLQVVASDLSPQALQVAKENAAANGCDIQFLEGDLFAPFAGKKCDFFVCNPPYISESEYLGLSREVKDFEPRLALVGGKSGFEFYERISVDLKKYLVTGGRGWLELGTGQGEPVLSLFSKQGWEGCSVQKDLSLHDRYFLI